MALVLCLAFNFFVHLHFGKELFLYSANWTYALVLLTALGCAPLFRHAWFRVLLAAFIILLAANDLGLISTIIEVSSSSFA
jgi:hypothetical protein